MNIFVLDTDPRTAAQLHCDTHVVKMILETTQILCTVCHMAGNPVPDGYKPLASGLPQDGGTLSPFVFVGPDSCIRPTIVESYRTLYRLKQYTMKVPMRWTNRSRPEWMDLVPSSPII